MTIQQYLLNYLQNRPLFLSLIRAKEAELFSRFFPLKTPVLDVGVGDGFFARLVFKNIDVGLDVADSRMNEAQKLNVYKKLVAYDGKIFPFKTNSFATIVSNCVLEHVSSLSEVISEMYRVLKPGGKAIISVMAKPWEENLVGSLFLGNSYKQYMRDKQVHLNLFTLEDWKKAFKKPGFKVEIVTGYLDPQACKLIDIAHYLSIPSLITYKLFGKWVIFPGLSQIYPTKWLTKIINRDVSPEKSGAIFFILQKS